MEGGLLLVTYSTTKLIQKCFTKPSYFVQNNDLHVLCTSDITNRVLQACNNLGDHQTNFVDVEPIMCSDILTMNMYRAW